MGPKKLLSPKTFGSNKIGGPKNFGLEKKNLLHCLTFVDKTVKHRFIPWEHYTAKAKTFQPLVYMWFFVFWCKFPLRGCVYFWGWSDIEDVFIFEGVFIFRQSSFLISRGKWYLYLHSWSVQKIKSVHLPSSLCSEGVWFLGSMLPQYMALSVSFVSQFVKKKNLGLFQARYEVELWYVDCSHKYKII